MTPRVQEALAAHRSRKLEEKKRKRAERKRQSALRSQARRAKSKERLDRAWDAAVNKWAELRAPRAVYVTLPSPTKKKKTKKKK